MTEFVSGPFKDNALNLIIEKHMSADQEEPKLRLAQIEQVEYTEHAAELWQDRDKVPLNATTLYSRFLEIEQTCDLCRIAGLSPSLDNINQVLKSQNMVPLCSRDIKMLCVLAPWLYKLTEEVVLGKHTLLLLPLSPVDIVTKDWLVTTRRMVMFSAIVNWFKRNQAHKGSLL